MPLDKFERRELPFYRRTGFKAGPSEAAPTIQVTEAGTVAVSGNMTVTGTTTQTGAQAFAAAPTMALGLFSTAQSLTPTATDTAGVNVILPGVTSVRLGANVTDANDYTVLPALSSVPNGHCITIIAGSAANSEVRTPASSAEEINSEDCDGTKEYLLTATEIHRFTKIDNTIGWMGQGFTAIGAVATAVVPDA